MHARERVEAVLNGRKPDRIPNFNIVMFFSAKQGGRSFRDYVSDYRVLCDCDFAVSERYGIDMLSAISDPMREAEGFGARVRMPENGVPYSPVALIDDLYDAPDKLKPYDPYNGKRSEDRLRAIEHLQQYRGEYVIGGWVEGAFAEACDLRGINDFLTDIACEDEDAIHALLDITCRQAIRFATAQVKAGADIIGIGDAASSLISPAMYRTFAFPYQKAIVEAVHAAGGRTKLHICGNTSKVLDQMVETGSDIVDVDWMVDLRAARDAAKGRHTVICGNYDPVAILLQGTPELVRERVNACADLFDGGYISSAGCEVPMDTPEENLTAVLRALEERGV